MTLRSFASFLSLPLVIAAACGGTAPEAGPDAGSAAPDATPGAPDAGAPDATPAALVSVEIRTGADEVLFHDPDGSLVARVPVTDGVARAKVPAGTTATVGRETGRIQSGAGTQILYRYETATALADGDVITLAPAFVAPADLPAVTVTLPDAPAGTTQVVARGCRPVTISGATVTLDRTRCGDHKGAVFLAGDPAPRYVLVALDLGAGPALDLSAQAWQPLTDVAVSFEPAPRAQALWLATGGVVLDDQVVPFDSARLATGPITIPMLVGGPVPGVVSASLGRTQGPRVQTLDKVALAHASADPFTIDLSTSAFPAIAADLTDARAFALTGPVDDARDAMQVTAFVGDATTQITWTVHLRGADRAIRLPTEGTPRGALTSVKLGFARVSDGDRASRDVRFFAAAAPAR